jgi:tRNA(Ile)-lysidine synthase
MPNAKRRSASGAFSIWHLAFAICHLPLTECSDMPLSERVLDTIRRHALLGGGARILVALSGGADSVALLLILRELERDGVVAVAGAAHLNHLLRGAEADADEAFCAALTTRLGVPFAAERVDVAALARAGKRSIEDAARTARYAFLDRAANALGADAIAVAHTKEDQAETFLLRLLRGAGTRGLAAIRPRVGRVIRPLLDVERAALRGYLAASGAAFREDASNADVSIPRNRVRHELIPLLEARFSPAVTAVLAREAALARDDEEFLQAEAIKLASRIVLIGEASDPAAVFLDTAELLHAPRALASRVVAGALQRQAGSRPIHFDHVERVLALAAAEGGGAVSLPGQSAVRAGGRIMLRRQSGRARTGAARRTPGEGEEGLVLRSVPGDGGNSFAFSLSIPGEVALGPQRLAVRAERLSGTDAASWRHRQWAARGVEVGVAAGALQLPLAVRSRRPGDRFRPLGAPGGRKLQDFFVDRKVPRAQRDTVPLVVDGNDRIVWVVGQTVAEDFRVTDPSLGVILLKVRHLGGPG